MLHNGFSGSRNSYVAMSRHIEDLHLYANNEATMDERQLILQLSLDRENGASINYKTKSELMEDQKVMEQNVFTSAALGVFEYAKEKIEKYSDIYGKHTGYYHFEKPIASKVEVEEILELVHEYKENTDFKNSHNDNGGHSEHSEADEKQQQAERFDRLVVGIDSHQSQVSVVDKANQTNKLSTNITNQDVVTSINDVDLNKDRGNLENGILSKSGDENIASKSGINNNARKRQSVKERFYANAEFVRKQKQLALHREKYREQYREQVEYLRSEMRFKAEAIATSLLGDPNRKLSNGHTLKYGNKGSLAIKIMGERSGSWYDFSSGEGGDLFDLVQETRKCDFKEAVSYVQSHLGISRVDYESSIRIANDNATEDKYISYSKNADSKNKSEALKLQKVEKLYARSKDIENNDVASKYLSEKRSICCNLGDDLKKANIYVTSGDKGQKGKYLPAIVAFARDSGGNITGGQQIILDKRTHDKADIAAPKKSFGKISGSFVEIGVVGKNAGLDRELLAEYNSGVRNEQRNDKVQSNITIIAEGVETALSVKQAINQHTGGQNQYQQDKVNIRVVCSLGLHNVKNYVPEFGERVIIAADNDGANSNNKNLVNKSVSILSKNAIVAVVSPRELGDFNDMLKQDAKSGSKNINKLFAPAVGKLVQYNQEEISVILKSQLQASSDKSFSQLASQVNVLYDSRQINEQNNKTAENDKNHKYSFDTQRHGLDNKGNSNVDSFLKKHKVSKQFAAFAKNYDLGNLKVKLSGFNDVIKQKLLDIELRKVIEIYVANQMHDFRQERVGSKNIESYLTSVKKEQEFVFNLYNSQRMKLKASKSEIIQSIKQQHAMYKENPNILNQFKMHHDHALSLGLYKSKKHLLHKIKHSSKSIDQISGIMKKICQEGVISGIKKDMSKIDNGYSIRDSKSVYSDKRALLRLYKADPAVNMYAKGFIKSQIRSIDRADNLAKANSQELQNPQQPKMEKTKSKDFGFSI